MPRRRSDRDLRFLIDASRVLADSLDFDRTVVWASRLALPDLADWCVVEYAPPAGLGRVAVAHADPVMSEWASRLEQQLGQRLAVDAGQLPASRVPEFVDPVDHQSLVSMAGGDALLVTLLRRGGARSLVRVPLVAHGRNLGKITFAIAESDLGYSRWDVDLFSELTSRCAFALDNAAEIREARDAIAAREEFFSVVCHELNTPLAALKLYLQSLIRVAQQAPSDAARLEKVAARSQVAARQVDRLSALVDTLLDVSRLQRGTFGTHLVFEHVDLAALATEMVERFGEEARRVGCALTLKTDSGVEAHCDPTRIDEVLTNLLSNALKYASGRPIDVRVTRGEGVAQISVEDQGYGIAREDHDRISGARPD
jgi:signal transduction histidine kinase